MKLRCASGEAPGEATGSASRPCSGPRSRECRGTTKIFIPTHNKGSRTGRNTTVSSGDGARRASLPSSNAQISRKKSQTHNTKGRGQRTRLQRILNLVLPFLVFLTLTDLASFRRAVTRNSLRSLIRFGILTDFVGGVKKKW